MWMIDLINKRSKVTDQDEYGPMFFFIGLWKYLVNLVNFLFSSKCPQNHLTFRIVLSKTISRKSS